MPRRREEDDVPDGSGGSHESGMPEAGWSSADPAPADSRARPLRSGGRCAPQLGELPLRAGTCGDAPKPEAKLSMVVPTLFSENPTPFVPAPDGRPRDPGTGGVARCPFMPLPGIPNG